MGAIALHGPHPEASNARAQSFPLTPLRCPALSTQAHSQEAVKSTTTSLSPAALSVESNSGKRAQGDVSLDHCWPPRPAFDHAPVLEPITFAMVAGGGVGGQTRRRLDAPFGTCGPRH